ncbi:hypothetical protein EGJ48_22255 [Pantoea dispersa]|nr:hypothetical protein EGJ48_22255 [Pantoea dispersa]
MLPAIIRRQHFLCRKLHGMMGERLPVRLQGRRSAEVFTSRQEIPAGRGNQAGPVRMTDTGRSVRRGGKTAGTAQRREE